MMILAYILLATFFSVSFLVFILIFVVVGRIASIELEVAASLHRPSMLPLASFLWTNT
jgi:hypothetical protein